MFHQTYFNFLSRIIYFQRRKKIKLKEKTLQYQPITQRHESLSPLIKTTQNFIYKRWIENKRNKHERTEPRCMMWPRQTDTQKITTRYHWRRTSNLKRRKNNNTTVNTQEKWRKYERKKSERRNGQWRLIDLLMGADGDWKLALILTGIKEKFKFKLTFECHCSSHSVITTSLRVNRTVISQSRGARTWSTL